jgi:hopanoid-associated phosphorylase
VTIIAVSGLMREARIAAGPGITALACGGNAVLLRGRLEQAIAQGAAGIISIGIAGGLAPALKPGDCVVASDVLAGGARFVPDAQWTARLLSKLPNAIRAPVAGVDAITLSTSAKSALFRETGAYAVDMESHIVARAAEAHRLPFAVLRTISDPADSALPPLASVAMTGQGTLNLGAVLNSILCDPRQISLLPRTARESKAAFAALLRCRRALGLGLLGPDGSELALDMG